MRTRTALFAALILFLFVLPAAVRAEDVISSDAPVRVKVVGLSKDRRGVHLQVTVLTKRAIRSVEQDVNAYTEEEYVGASTLTWKVSGSLAQGKTYDVVDRTLLKKAVPKDETLSVQRGVMRVNFADGTRWTSAGKYGINGSDR